MIVVFNRFHKMFLGRVENFSFPLRNGNVRLYSCVSEHVNVMFIEYFWLIIEDLVFVAALTQE